MSGEDAPPGLPERRPIAGGFDFFVRAWRPFVGWTCGVILLVRGAAMPLVELAQGRSVSPIDWIAVVALVGALGFGRWRTIEKQEGLTS